MCILANDANITAQVKNKITFLDITIRNNEAVIQIVIVLNRLISLKCFANKGVKNKVDVVLENNAGTLIEKGKENQISQAVEINNNIEAPNKKGDVLR